eukprot:4134450-Amphidinium_carterae.1
MAEQWLWPAVSVCMSHPTRSGGIACCWFPCNGSFLSIAVSSNRRFRMGGPPTCSPTGSRSLYLLSRSQLPLPVDHVVQFVMAASWPSLHTVVGSLSILCAAGSCFPRDCQ